VLEAKLMVTNGSLTLFIVLMDNIYRSSWNWQNNSMLQAPYNLFFQRFC